MGPEEQFQRENGGFGAGGKEKRFRFFSISSLFRLISVFFFSTSSSTSSQKKIETRNSKLETQTPTRNSNSKTQKLKKLLTVQAMLVSERITGSQAW